MEKQEENIIFPNNSAYLPGVKAAVTIGNSQDIFQSINIKPIPADAISGATKGRGLFPGEKAMTFRLT